MLKGIRKQTKHQKKAENQTWEYVVHENEHSHAGPFHQKSPPFSPRRIISATRLARVSQRCAALLNLEHMAKQIVRQSRNFHFSTSRPYININRKASQKGIGIVVFTGLWYLPLCERPTCDLRFFLVAGVLRTVHSHCTVFLSY